jgi:hypothetical protein
MGNSAYAAKNYAQASGYYQSAINENPSNWVAYQCLGNCLYFQGNLREALRNYETSLSLNPTNSQLSQYVQVLRAKVGGPVEPQPMSQAASTPVLARSAPGANNPELDVDAGLSLGSLTGFGGGLGLYFPMDKNMLLGGSAAFYTFSAGAAASLNAGYGSVSAGGGSSTDVIELMFSGKYVFDGTNVRPYLWGGAGAAYVITSANAGGSANSGSAGVSENLNMNGSTIDPMLSVGGGVQVPVGNNMNFYGQARLEMLISLAGTNSNISGGSSMGGSISGNVSTSGGGTSVYVPIEAGLQFNL